MRIKRALCKRGKWYTLHYFNNKKTLFERYCSSWEQVINAINYYDKLFEGLM